MRPRTAPPACPTLSTRSSTLSRRRRRRPAPLPVVVALSSSPCRRRPAPLPVVVVVIVEPRPDPCLPHPAQQRGARADPRRPVLHQDGQGRPRQVEGGEQEDAPQEAVAPGAPRARRGQEGRVARVARVSASRACVTVGSPGEGDQQLARWAAAGQEGTLEGGGGGGRSATATVPFPPHLFRASLSIESVCMGSEQCDLGLDPARSTGGKAGAVSCSHAHLPAAVASRRLSPRLATPRHGP